MRSTLELFHHQASPARRAYARFVAEGIEAPDPTAQVRHQLYLATDRFIEKVGARAAAQRPASEVPRTQRVVKTLTTYASQNRNRNEAIRQAYNSGAYTLNQIGRHFALHYSVVSRIARNCYESVSSGHAKRKT